MQAALLAALLLSARTTEAMALGPTATATKELLLEPRGGSGDEIGRSYAGHYAAGVVPPATPRLGDRKKPGLEKATGGGPARAQVSRRSTPNVELLRSAPGRLLQGVRGRKPPGRQGRQVRNCGRILLLFLGVLGLQRVIVPFFSSLLEALGLRYAMALRIDRVGRTAIRRRRHERDDSLAPLQHAGWWSRSHDHRGSSDLRPFGGIQGRDGCIGNL